MRRIESIELFIKTSDEIIARSAARESQRKVLVCTGGGCIASGSLDILKAFRESLGHAKSDVQVVGTGCMGPCSKGPLICILPEKIIYEHVSVQDVQRIVDSHLGAGKQVEDLLLTDDHPHKVVGKAEGSSFLGPQEKIVLRNCGTIDPLDIESYIAVRGYRGLAKALGNMSADQIIAEMKESNLKGRGGAGFPTWMKWQLTRESKGTEKYVLCNADEGDPGAFMDRSVLEGDPHSIVEGMVIAAYTVGATQGYVYVRAEYPLAVARLRQAIEQARAYGLLGTDILGTGFSFDLDIRMGSGAFVCGEETALINSIEGKRGEPRPRPPFPAQKGLWDSPTL
ncbi:MAG: NAD(P)H-dependent oxidoreductase subunit E, partial [Sphaerochaetaceae bacterium]|nr:NAD(P)H-dependent oxidoreductase subunit E [Sphaerochaetaceae bacterium]